MRAASINDTTRTLIYRGTKLLRIFYSTKLFVKFLLFNERLNTKVLNKNRIVYTDARQLEFLLANACKFQIKALSLQRNTKNKIMEDNKKIIFDHPIGTF